MEEEIDLRQYIDVLIRWWWLIALGAIVTGFFALVVSFLMPPKYEATAGVVALKSRVELSLGSGFQSLTEEDIAYSQMAGNALAERNKQRLNSLAAMVHSGAIAEQVAAELREMLIEDVKNPENLPAGLLGAVKGEIVENSDTIQIVVSNRDPVKAAAIANAWARAFETHVNAIYGEAPYMPFSDISNQVAEARAEYDRAQEALLTFLTENDKSSELQRQIAEEEVIIASLRTGRQTAISAIMDKEVQVKQRLIDAYLDDDAANRLFAFNKGQEAKRQILGAWIDAEVANRIAAINRDRDVRLKLFSTSVAAEIESRMRVFEQERDKLLRELDETYARKHRLENLLLEVRTMREQLVLGGEASARSNGLALLSLKSRVFAVAEGLPFNTLDLQVSSIDALSPYRSAAEQIADLDGLSAAMEKEIAALELSIQEQSAALLSGEGYQFLNLLSPEYLAISGSRASPITRTAGVTRSLTISTSLGDFIAQRYGDLFDVGEMARSAEHVAVDTPLFAEIQSLYPELFKEDAWMQLAESVPDATDLSKRAATMAEDLLKLRGLEDLLSYSTLDEPLSQEIMRRERNVRALQAEVARINQVRTDLQQDRDLAWQAYSKLLSKEQEVRIASASEGSEVRFASPALPPIKPASPRKMLNTAVGSAAGLMMGVFGAFLFDYLGLNSSYRYWYNLATEQSSRLRAWVAQKRKRNRTSGG